MGGKKRWGGLSWRSSGQDFALPQQGARVRSLVWELRSRKRRGAGKKKKKKAYGLPWWNQDSEFRVFGPHSVGTGFNKGTQASAVRFGHHLGSTALTDGVRASFNEASLLQMFL